jgi:hypothetical protein
MAQLSHFMFTLDVTKRHGKPGVVVHALIWLLGEAEVGGS